MKNDKADQKFFKFLSHIFLRALMHTHKNLKLELKLSTKAKTFAESCINTLISSESKIHGISEDSVHFHEASSIDTLIDIVGITIALEDLKLFEVDEAVNKIRAEVDPEAELIFGSIEDEKLNGKIRVSIVATSLDGQEPEAKPVISLVHRLQNRNVPFSDNVPNTLVTNQETINAT